MEGKLLVYLFLAASIAILSSFGLMYLVASQVPDRVSIEEIFHE